MQPRFSTGRPNRPRPIANSPTRIAPRWWCDLVRRTSRRRRLYQNDLSIATNTSGPLLSRILSMQCGIAHETIVAITTYLEIPSFVFVAENADEARAIGDFIAQRASATSHQGKET